MTDSNNYLAPFFAFSGAIAGSVGTVLLGAMQGRRQKTQTLQQSVDARIDALLSGYENRIAELTGEILSQRAEIITLTNEIHTLQGKVRTLLEKLVGYEQRTSELPEPEVTQQQHREFRLLGQSPSPE